ncbi:MAG: DUF1553 domain-containing protein, partial [Verrucomicrobiota bacterium]
IPVDELDKNKVVDLVTGSSAPVGAGGKFEPVDREKGKKGINLNGRTVYDLPTFTELESDMPWTFSAYVYPNNSATGAIFSNMDTASKFRGFDIWLQGGGIGTHIIDSWQDNALKVVSDLKLKEKAWNHVVVSYDGSKKATGVKLFVNGQLAKNKVEADSLTGSIKTKGGIPYRIGARDKGSNINAKLDDIRFYNRAFDQSDLPLAQADPLQGLLGAKNLTKLQSDLLLNHFLIRQDKEYAKKIEARDKAVKAYVDLDKKPTTTMVMGDNPPNKMRMTYVLDRGAYDAPKKEEEIAPGIPAALPALPEGSAPNRLTLANWFFSDEQPLTSRVAVNQFWLTFMGQGIVSTPGDFGNQGAFPSHPELLDWLAVDFRESGWDVKRLVKMILMSDAYRRSSVVNRSDYDADMDNQWLARASRNRLPAEMIRDNALAISGLLNKEMAGPGVKPYQPPGLWAEVSLGGNPKFVQDHGEKLYRRSLYTYWKRSSPPPAMLIFDAPNREICVLQRPNTNTPLQALAAMNDVQMIEAARFFAERIIAQGGESETKASFAFAEATARQPESGEVASLMEIYLAAREAYTADEEQAKSLLAAGEKKRNEQLDLIEHAAWTMVATTLLNLDEVLTRN